MSRLTERRYATAAMVVLLLLAAALRFHLLEVQSFWNDEGNSARLSERSLALIVEGTASDIHPPLYYVLLRGWREVVSETEFGLRALSAFLGVGLVAAVYSLGRQLAGPIGHGAAIAGAFVAAVNPALIYYSQEARMYELLAFLALISTLLLVHFLGHKSRRFGPAIAFVVVTAAGLYTHYFYPAVLFAQNMVFGIWLYDQTRSGKKRLWPEARAWLLMMLTTLLLYVPWLPIFFRQTGGREGSRPAPGVFLEDSATWLTAGPTGSPEASVITLLAFFLLAATGAYFGRTVKRSGLRYTTTLLSMAFVPLLTMWLIGATQPAFFKFMLVIIPPLCLLAGAGWWWGWHDGVPEKSSIVDTGPSVGKIMRRLVVIILALPIVWGSYQALRNMYYEPNYARADYRAMAAQVAVEAHPNAAVVLNAANQWEVFTYYHQDGAPVFPIPRGYPDPAIIDDELSDIIANHGRIYAIFWGEGQRDPQRLVERWLDANAFKAREEWVGDVRFVTYAVAGEPAGKLVEAPDLRWADAIQLASFTLSTTELPAGDIVQVALSWQSDRPLSERYKVFLHLVDSQGRIVAQRDSEPGGGLALTTTWQPGKTIVDNHGLLVPPGTPSEEYTLLLGLYELADPAARLMVETSEGSTDAVPLGTIIVNEG
ncbi:MAG: glycosyltransferase family 39 protein [Chloroflexota bacterium]|nr:MAG: glycosyltransferase family 39 protein [Chloroflexota bacterium]